MVDARSISSRDVKKLYGLTRNQCSNPGCRKPLIVPGQTPGIYGQLGKIAHIRAAEDGGSRWDPAMTDDERRSFANLILLCSRCHDLVDDVELVVDYSVSLLERWKREHEDSSWQPSENIHDWGVIVVHEDGEQIELPYFRTADGLRFFSDEQWAIVERAFWIYVEISELVSALDGARTMNQTHIQHGIHGSNSITQNIERLYSPNRRQRSDLLPETTDPAIYESPASRIFSMMLGNPLTLDHLLWLSTHPQRTVVATSLSAFEG